MIRNKTIALLTGGSHGIGLELARCFARDGWQQLILVAKPAEELAHASTLLTSEFPALAVITRVQDLSLPNAGQVLFDWTQAQGFVVNALVNSAGFGTWGFFNDLDRERDQEMFRLNMLTVYDLTRCFARDMIGRDEGHILNIASTAAIVQSPYLAAYSATKGFVYNLSVAYDDELRQRGSKVRIIALCPPATRTGFQKAAQMEKSTLYRGFWSLDAEQVAAEGYRALLRGKRWHIPGPVIGLLTKVLVRLLPLQLKLAITRQHTKYM